MIFLWITGKLVSVWRFLLKLFNSSCNFPFPKVLEKILVFNIPAGFFKKLLNNELLFLNFSINSAVCISVTAVSNIILNNNIIGI
ncbi:hypothetical protein [Spiroplasma endosymbiont of Amphimallon solstitiale]|uniref:hypothetical protein n=1 Tax=Spiroplasma endosymbiont of Amphimallon solstitiale TaxID=3066288 RepID=UPI00313CC107